jgi:hypothetical protein
MDVAGGQCARRRDLAIEEFGRKFANIFCQLNDTCRQFFEFLSNHVFTNEKEWRSALLVFKNSVLASAGTACSRNEANEIYRQVENFLLDPTNLRLVKNQSGRKVRLAIEDSLINLSLDVSRRSSATHKCVYCKVPSGIFVRCSMKRCPNTFHVFCAAAVTRCKNPPSLYYRCRSCAPSVTAGGAVLDVSTAKKKRPRPTQKKTFLDEKNKKKAEKKEEEEE